MAASIEEEEKAAVFSAGVALKVARQVQVQLASELHERQDVREGLNPHETMGLKYEEVPRCTAAVFAGLQHCRHAPDGPSSRGKTLYYTDTKSKMKQMTSKWACKGIRCGISLGNLIDRRCGPDWKTEQAMEDVQQFLLEDFKSQTWRWRLQQEHVITKFRGDILHVVGDHDLEHQEYNKIAPLLGFSNYVFSVEKAYHAIQCCKGWKMVFLDTLDVSVYSKDQKKRIQARDILERSRKFKEGLTAAGGAIGEEQLEWLRSELDKSKTEKEFVVIFSYSPLNKGLAKQGHLDFLCWNHHDVEKIFHSYPGLITCCFSGQQPEGGLFVDDQTRRMRGKIYHVGIFNCIHAPPQSECDGILELYEKRLRFRGQGAVVSVSMDCAFGELLSKIKD